MFRQGARPRWASDFADEVVDYTRRWWGAESRLYKPKPKPKAKSKAKANANARAAMNLKTVSKIQRFYGIVGGGFAAGEGRSECLVVYIDGPITQEVMDRIISELAELIDDIHFGSRFTKPALTKWSQVGKCTDRILVGVYNDVIIGPARIGLADLSFGVVTETKYDDGLSEINSTIEFRRVMGRNKE